MPLPSRLPRPLLLPLLPLLSLLLFALPAAPAAAAPGALLAMGGAVADASPLWGELVRLAGGPGARLALLTMASENPDAAAAALARRLQRHGAQVVHVRVGPRASGDALADAVRDPAWLDALASAQGAVFSGGDQSLITQTLAPEGRPTPLLAALHALRARGGVVAGTSAGAAVMSRRMFTGGEPLELLQDDGARPLAPGLGLVDADLLVDQHFLRRGRVGRLLPTLLREGIPLGLGIDEDSAVLLRGSQAEVLGARGALLLDLRDATRDGALPAFNVQGVRVSYLEAGDRLDLRTLAVTPSAAKAAGRLVAPPPPGFRPYWRGPVFFADMLADFAIVQAMQQLVDSPRDEVRGLSFDALAPAGSRRAQLGFEWVLSRDAATRAWNVDDAYSVAGVRLAVRPVRMASPLFGPW